MASGTSLDDVFHFDEQGTLPPPDPIGRLVRFAMGVLIAALIYDWLVWIDISDSGNPFILLWIAVSIALVPYVVNIGFGIKSGAIPRYALLGIFVLATAAGFLVEGNLRSEILWTAVKITQLYIYGHLGISFLLSAALATPGCEMRAIPHLVGKVTGKGSREHYCPGFIDNVDRWEHDRAVKDQPDEEHVVEFLSFEGCPLAPEALNVLKSAVDQLRGRLHIEIEHIDLMDSDTPEELKRWGSPTMLVAGRDITGARPGDANSCRIYHGPGGVPTQHEIVRALSRALEK